MIHQFIIRWSGKAPVKQLCRLLQVSRSGYYAARHRASLAPTICAQSVQVAAIFEASGRTYGSRRVSAALKQQGHEIGRHRARTLMKAAQMRPKWRRKFMHTTDSRHGLPVAANVLEGDFMP